MLKIEPVSTDAMEVAVSIEKDIPSRITGENRVFIRAVIARAITAAVAAEREACAESGRAAVMKFRAKVGGRYYPGYHEDMREAVASAIRARSTP